MRKYKHITDTDRPGIEHGRRHGLPLKKIAAKIGKHRSTLAREIRPRRVPSDKGALECLTHRGLRRRSCKRRQLCEERNPEASCANATTCIAPPAGTTATCSSALGRTRISPRMNRGARRARPPPDSGRASPLPPSSRTIPAGPISTRRPPTATSPSAFSIPSARPSSTSGSSPTASSAPPRPASPAALRTFPPPSLNNARSLATSSDLILI
jgi:hypothetical protein